MELTSPSDPSRKYLVVPPIFADGKVVGVMEGKHVQGAVKIAEVTALRFERRTSFRHPWVGLLLGIVLIAIPAASYLGNPAERGWAALGVRFGCLGSLFMLLAGCYLLWGVVRRRDIPWLIFSLGENERRFPLDGPLSRDAVALLRSVCGNKFEVGQCTSCGYDLRATPERCPECGAVTESAA